MDGSGQAPQGVFGDGAGGCVVIGRGCLRSPKRLLSEILRSVSKSRKKVYGRKLRLVQSQML